MRNELDSAGTIQICITNPLAILAGGFVRFRGTMGRLNRLPTLVGSAPDRVRFAPKAADPFYLSRAWRVLVAAIKRERGDVCEDCGAVGGTVRDDGRKVRIIGDHVRERKDGGAALDPANVRLRCDACHGTKTAARARARARGQV